MVDTLYAFSLLFCLFIVYLQYLRISLVKSPNWLSRGVRWFCVNWRECVKMRKKKTYTAISLDAIKKNDQFNGRSAYMHTYTTTIDRYSHGKSIARGRCSAIWQQDKYTFNLVQCILNIKRKKERRKGTTSNGTDFGWSSVISAISYANGSLVNKGHDRFTD